MLKEYFLSTDKAITNNFLLKWWTNMIIIFVFLFCLRNIPFFILSQWFLNSFLVSGIWFWNLKCNGFFCCCFAFLIVFAFFFLFWSLIHFGLSDLLMQFGLVCLKFAVCWCISTTVELHFYSRIPQYLSFSRIFIFRSVKRAGAYFLQPVC